MRSNGQARSLVIAALLAAACDRPSTSTSTSTPTPTLEPALASALRSASVTESRFAHRVLFSWTSPDQEAALRRDRKLLIPGELPSGPTPYVERLGEVASKSGPFSDMARVLLLHPSFALRRYAWTRPWPTRLGTGDRAFGDVLVRVVLAPNAIIARFDPGRPDVFSFHDLDERPVPLGAVLADPSRLAAVLHVRTDAATPVAHREYVLCNESMIADWSVATPAAHDALESDAALLQKLASANVAPGAARALWQSDRARDRDSDDGAALFASTLAFDAEPYRSSQAALSALADALRRVPPPKDAPLVVAPQSTFAFDAVVPQVPLRRPPVRVARVV